MSNPQGSLNSTASTGAELVSSGDTLDASGTEVPGFLPTGAITNFPAVNPPFGRGIAFGGPVSPFGSFPGEGSSGASATGAALNLEEGSSPGVMQLQQPVSVPEPSTVLLLGSALALAAYRRRRRLMR